MPFTCNLCLEKDPVCSQTYFLKEKSGNPVCLALLFFFLTAFYIPPGFYSRQFQWEAQEPRDLACLYLRKNCLSYCCSSLAPCLELPCILLELLSWLLAGNAAEEGGQGTRAAWCSFGTVGWQLRPMACTCGLDLWAFGKIQLFYQNHGFASLILFSPWRISF